MASSPRAIVKVEDDIDDANVGLCSNLVHLTEEQAQDVGYPLDCPVRYNFRATSNSKELKFCTGRIVAVLLNKDTRKLVFRVERKGSSDGSVETVEEHSIAFEKNCPVQVEDGSRKSDGKIRSSKPVFHDNGNIETVEYMVYLSSGGSRGKYLRNVPASTVKYKGPGALLSSVANSSNLVQLSEQQAQDLSVTYPLNCAVQYNFEATSNNDICTGIVKSVLMDRDTRKFSFRVEEVDSSGESVEIIEECNIAFADECPVRIITDQDKNDGEIICATPIFHENGNIKAMTYDVNLFLGGCQSKDVYDVPAKDVRFRTVEQKAVVGNVHIVESRSQPFDVPSIEESPLPRPNEHLEAKCSDFDRYEPIEQRSGNSVSANVSRDSGYETLKDSYDQALGLTREVTLMRRTMGRISGPGTAVAVHQTADHHTGPHASGEKNQSGHGSQRREYGPSSKRKRQADCDNNLNAVDDGGHVMDRTLKGETEKVDDAMAVFLGMGGFIHGSNVRKSEHMPECCAGGSERNQNSPKGSRDNAIVIDEDDDVIDQKILPIAIDRGKGSNIDSNVAATTACGTRLNRGDYEHLNTFESATYSPALDEEKMDPTMGMADLEPKKKFRSNSGIDQRKSSSFFSHKNKPNPKTNVVSSSNLTASAHGRAGSTAGCTLDEPMQKKTDWWMSPYKQGCAAQNDRNESARSNVMEDNAKKKASDSSANQGKTSSAQNADPVEAAPNQMNETFSNREKKFKQGETMPEAIREASGNESGTTSKISAGSTRRRVLPLAWKPQDQLKCTLSDEKPVVINEKSPAGNTKQAPSCPILVDPGNHIKYKQNDVFLCLSCPAYKNVIFTESKKRRQGKAEAWKVANEVFQKLKKGEGRFFKISGCTTEYMEVDNETALNKIYTDIECRTASSKQWRKDTSAKSPQPAYSATWVKPAKFNQNDVFMSLRNPAYRAIIFEVYNKPGEERTEVKTAVNEVFQRFKKGGGRFFKLLCCNGTEYVEVDKKTAINKIIRDVHVQRRKRMPWTHDSNSATKSLSPAAVPPISTDHDRNSLKSPRRMSPKEATLQTNAAPTPESHDASNDLAGAAGAKDDEQGISGRRLAQSNVMKVMAKKQELMANQGETTSAKKSAPKRKNASFANRAENVKQAETMPQVIKEYGNESTKGQASVPKPKVARNSTCIALYNPPQQVHETKKMGKSFLSTNSSSKPTQMEPDQSQPRQVAAEKNISFSIIPAGQCSQPTQLSNCSSDLLSLFLRTNTNTPRLKSSVWDFLTLCDMYRLRCISKSIFKVLGMVKYERCHDGKDYLVPFPAYPAILSTSSNIKSGMGLFTHQLASLRAMHKAENNNTSFGALRGGILGDAPGLGKTITMLALITSTSGMRQVEPKEFYDSDSIDENWKILRTNGVFREEILRAMMPFRDLPLHDEVSLQVSPPYEDDRFPTMASFEQFVNRAMRKTAPQHGLHLFRQNVIALKAKLDKRNRRFFSKLKGKRMMFERNLIPCSTTLIVVPDALLEHWAEQIRRHVNLALLADPNNGGGNNGVVYIDGVGDLSTARFPLTYNTRSLPSPFELSRNTIVVVPFLRIKQQYSNAQKHQREDDAINLMGGFEKSTSLLPLLEIRWFRIVVDEGHELGKNEPGSDVTKFVNEMGAERRWVMSGTPTTGVEESQDFTAKGLDQLQRLLLFLRHERYGCPYGTLSAKQGNCLAGRGGGKGNKEHAKSAWDVGVKRPFLKKQDTGRKELYQVLDEVMVMHKKEDVGLPKPIFKQSEVSIPVPADVQSTILNAVLFNDSNNALCKLGISDHNQKRFCSAFHAGGSTLFDVLVSEYLETDGFQALVDEAQANFIASVIKREKLALEDRGGAILDDVTAPITTARCSENGVDRRPIKAVVYSSSRNNLLSVAEYLYESFDNENIAEMLEGKIEHMSYELGRFRNNYKEGKICPICGSWNEFSGKPLKRCSNRLLEVSDAKGNKYVIEPERIIRAIGKVEFNNTMNGVVGDHPVDMDRLAGEPLTKYGISHKHWKVGDALCIDARDPHPWLQKRWSNKTWAAYGSARCVELAKRNRYRGGDNYLGPLPKVVGGDRCEVLVRLDKWQACAEFHRRWDSTRKQRAGWYVGPTCGEVGLSRQNEDTFILLLDASLSHGLDLSFVTHMFLLEPIDDAALLEQVTSRAHRLGCTGPVTVETIHVWHEMGSSAKMVAKHLSSAVQDEARKRTLVAVCDYCYRSFENRAKAENHELTCCRNPNCNATVDPFHLSSVYRHIRPSAPMIVHAPASHNNKKGTKHMI